MRQFAVILIFLLGAAWCRAQQNLILNGRFEETVFPDSCFTGPIYKDIFVGLDSRHFIRDWWNPTNASPDYYNRCDTTDISSVPLSDLAGSQEDPYLENAYVGIGTISQIPYQEYMITHFKESLIAGKNYEFKMLVNTGDFFYYKTNLGICLEKDSIDFDSATIFTPHYPDYVFMSDSIIIDCENWHEIKLYFSPTIDSLRFLVIGTFPTVRTTLTLKVGLTDVCNTSILADTATASYYLIDDVRLYCLDCDTIDSTDTIPHEMPCTIAFPDAFTPNGDNVNDTWKPLITSACDNIISDYLLRIFDCWDNEIFKTTDKNEGWTGRQKDIGTYIYYIQYNDQNGTQKKTGSVELIR